MSSRFDSVCSGGGHRTPNSTVFIHSISTLSAEKDPPFRSTYSRLAKTILANRSITTVISLEFNGLRYKHTLVFHWLHDNVIEYRIDVLPSLHPLCSIHSQPRSLTRDNVKCAAVLPELPPHSVLSSSPHFHIESCRHWRNTHSKITLGTFAITK